jgi:hypothetical protein
LAAAFRAEELDPETHLRVMLMGTAPRCNSQHRAAGGWQSGSGERVRANPARLASGGPIAIGGRIPMDRKESRFLL